MKQAQRSEKTLSNVTQWHSRVQTQIWLTPRSDIRCRWNIRCNNGTNSILDEKYMIDFESAMVLPHQKENLVFLSSHHMPKCCPNLVIRFVSFRSLYSGCLCSAFELNPLWTQVPLPPPFPSRFMGVCFLRSILFLQPDEPGAVPGNHLPHLPFPTVPPATKKMTPSAPWAAFAPGPS